MIGLRHVGAAMLLWSHMQQLTAYRVQGRITKLYCDTGCALLLLNMKPESTSSSIQGSCPM